MNPHELAPRRLFLVAALLGGLAYAVVTPPFQVPDEPAHFYRAFSVSEGNLLVRSHNGVPGELLPSSLAALVRIMVDDVPFHPQRKVRPEAWHRARELELEPRERRFLGLTTSAHYSAIPYIPQAAGIAVGRLVRASPLALVYFARIANLVVATALIYFALCQLPGYRWLATLLALTPMAMFLRSSISADALTTAIAFALTATVAKLAFTAPAPRVGRDFALVVVLSAALCLTKPVYFPLVLAVFVIPAGRLPGRQRGLLALVLLATTICAVAGAVAIALHSVDVVSFITRLRINEALSRPLHLLGQVIVDYAVHAPRYGAEFIGRLGWLDTPLPLSLLLFHLVALLAFSVLDCDPSVVVKPWQRLILVLLVAASLAAVSTSMFVLGGRIAGIQGRYFHPIALAAAWVFHGSCRRRFKITDRVWPWVAVLTVFSLTISLLTLYRRYYG